MFQSRGEAGQKLAQKLQQYKNDLQAVVIAIPRGGVIVGKEIAGTLNIPLSVIVVKKLGSPNNNELAIGAVAPDGVKVIDWDLALKIGVEQEYLDEEIKRKRKDVEEREKKYQISKLKNQISNKRHIIITDDGVATGSTVLAALKYIRNLYPKPNTLNPNLILAVPVIAKDTFNKLKSEVGEVVTLEIPEVFNAVGQFYEEFPQVSDEEIINII